MIFSSWEFVFVFLPICLATFFLIPNENLKARKVFLVLASFCFYGYWKIEFLWLLGISTIVNYAVAELLIRQENLALRKCTVWMGVLANLISLGWFKYTNFVLEAISSLMQKQFDPLQIFLPLAISFFTFTQIGYLVDVYKDKKLHYGFLDYALFVVFFPHLIAGPIVRHWEVIPQFSELKKRACLNNFNVGLALFSLGLFKKVLIADAIAPTANAVFLVTDAGTPVTTLEAWIGLLAFTVQIYFDFSGYSDMAIGLARLFGIKFPVNFHTPYTSSSIADFWRRWHITLSRFLREYVYFPLGGNKKGFACQARNILVTMLISGLWHGAGWTFLIWGGLHGAYLIIENCWGRFSEKLKLPKNNRAYRTFTRVFTFLAVITGWIFFRATTLPGAWNMLNCLLPTTGFSVPDTFPAQGLLRNVGMEASIQRGNVIFGSVSVSILLVFAGLLISIFGPNTQQLLARYKPIFETYESHFSYELQFRMASGVIFGCLLFFVFRTFWSGDAAVFIYFNF